MGEKCRFTRAWGAVLAIPSLILILLVLSGCESAIPTVDPESPPFRDRPAAELAELQLGRRTYIAKCSGCHALYRPTRGDGAHWRRWVGEMAERSHLHPDERGHILDYLGLVCIPGSGPEVVR